MPKARTREEQAAYMRDYRSRQPKPPDLEAINAAQAARIAELEEDNARLKRLLAAASQKDAKPAPVDAGVRASVLGDLPASQREAQERSRAEQARRDAVLRRAFPRSGGRGETT